MSDNLNSAESANPYAPTSLLRPSDVEESADVRVFNLGKSVFVWTAVCSISAAPSFILGLSFAGNGWPWMVLGVLIFIAGYVAADRTTFDWLFRRRVAVRLSLRITYIIRIVTSIIFPVAFVVDMLCGMVSSQIFTIFGQTPGVPGGVLHGPVVLIWTLSQGIVMNGLLSIIWVILLGICWFVTKEPSSAESPD